MAIVLIATGAVLTLGAQPWSFWSSPRSAIRFDGLPIHSLTNPMFDFFLGHGWLTYLAAVTVFGIVVGVLTEALPSRPAMVTEFTLILGLCYSQSNWIAVRWHSGPGGAVLYTSAVAIGMAAAMLPPMQTRDDDALKRMCWSMALTTTLDGVFTLIGQPQSYWRNTAMVHEANPVSRYFLQIGWWAFAAYILAQFAVPWFLATRLSRELSWVMVLCMMLGGFLGGSNWLFYEWRLGLQAPLLYGMLLSEMITWSILRGNREAKPSERSTNRLARCGFWQC